MRGSTLDVLTSKVDLSVPFGLSVDLILLSLKSRMHCVTCISHDNLYYFTDNIRVAIYYKRNCINKFCCSLLEILFICIVSVRLLFINIIIWSLFFYFSSWSWSSSSDVLILRNVRCWTGDRNSPRHDTTKWGGLLWSREIMCGIHHCELCI